MVARLRLILGAGVLAFLPAARRRVERSEWPAIVVVSIAGNAGPALLFAFAERTLETSVAGMINSSVPLFTLLIAYGLDQRSSRPVQGAGLAIGFVGVVLLSIPNVVGAEAALGGVILVFVAVIGYWGLLRQPPRKDCATGHLAQKAPSDALDI